MVMGVARNWVIHRIDSGATACDFIWGKKCRWSLYTALNPRPTVTPYNKS